MKLGKIIEYDFQAVQDIFPKLKTKWNHENQCWYIKGIIDICDTQGDYWGSFDILIAVPYSYPYCIPVVWEISRYIKREDNWHINKEGICCLNIDHKMQFLAKRGINLLGFMVDYVYPYFANQFFRIKTGKYAGDEYRHHFEGVRQFYSEDLHVHDSETAILILEAILRGTIPRRNEKCLCKKAKFKKCHLSAVEFLLRMPKERLTLDLQEFKMFK